MLLQRKPYRFADDDYETPPPLRHAASGSLAKRAGRNMTFGLAVVAPLFVFTLHHPGASGVDPIGPALAAVGGSANGALEQGPLLLTGDPRIKSLTRLNAEIDAVSGELREIYGVGSITGADPALRIDARANAPKTDAQSLFVAIAESAAKMGAIVRRMGVQQPLATSRGPIEWADLVLTTSTGPRACIAFRAPPVDDMRLSGFLCGPNGVKPDQAALPCVIDRLELTPSARDAGFDALLKGAAVSRPACRNAML